MVAGKPRRRRAVVALLLAAPVLGAGWVAYLARHDPWPARASVRGEWPLAFTPDGRSFATAGRGGIVVREWATGVVRSPWPVPANQVAARGDFSPDGRTFAAAIRRDPEPVLVELIDVATGQVRATGAARHPRVGSVKFARDGAAVLLHSEDAFGLREVVAFDAATGDVRYTCPPEPPAGTRRVDASADNRFLIYSDAKGGPISLQEVGPPEGRRGPVTTGLASPGPSGAIGLAPDGRTLAVGRPDGTIDLWDVPGRRPIRTLPRPGAGSAQGSITFGPDGRTLAAVYGEGAASPFSAWAGGIHRALGRPFDPMPTEAVILDPLTGRCLGRLPGAQLLYHPPDGRRLASYDHLATRIDFRDIPGD